MDTQQRKKREWLLLFLILPFGIGIMFCAGQAALRQPPTWRVQAEMNSVLDPYVAQLYDTYGRIEPVRAEIMTLPAWMDTFLTPPATNTPLPAGTTSSDSSDSSSGSGGSVTALPQVTATLVSSPTPFPTATLIPTSTATLIPTPTIPPTPTYIPPTDSGGGGGGGGGDGCKCVEWAGNSHICKTYDPPGCGD